MYVLDLLSNEALQTTGIRAWG